MKSGLKKGIDWALSLAGYELSRLDQNPYRVLDRQIVELKPAGRVRGRVLLAYVIDPFCRKPGEPISNDHTNYWESHAIAECFLHRGFAVDVISYRNESFIPDRDYDYFVSARTNFSRLARHLNPGCTKVVHLDTAHWLFNNHAALSRLLDVQTRRGVTLSNAKMVEVNFAIEHADMGTVLGNGFTIGTYAYAGKPLHRIPISSPLTYDWPVAKDFDACRNRFLWFGSQGFVHKGLDLVLEAFAGLPDFELTVCGPIAAEKAFVQAYHQELYETPNIHAYGWIDVASKEFVELAQNTIGLVYPTCSEGGGGSALTCMHAAIIPMVTREASVDVADGGILLEDLSIEGIRNAIRAFANRPATELQATARRAWELAREHHTRENFARAFASFVDNELLNAG